MLSHTHVCGKLAPDKVVHAGRALPDVAVHVAVIGWLCMWRRMQVLGSQKAIMEPIGERVRERQHECGEAENNSIRSSFLSRCFVL